ncbi:MAG: hypothetical protein LQ339_003096 [Xanthoria mediterranea]|nr:MAG: hypothetical protein LQ339_003096 [Xanthoria mediterranea]
MTRKRKPPRQTHRLQVTGPDGWTRITKGFKNCHLKDSPRLVNQPPEIPPNQTLADLAKSHARYRDQWLSSPCYQTIQKLLLDDVIPALTSNGRTIDRCVMMGLGSLSNGQRSSWWELVFLESVLSLLPLASSASSQNKSPGPGHHQPSNPNISNSNEQKSATIVEEAEEPTTSSSSTSTPPNPPLRTNLPIYIQDPIFNPLDISYLTSSLGYTVLHHPAAFAHLTPSTFLFAPHLEMELYAWALSAAAGQLGQPGPTLCVGTDVAECIDRLTTMLEGDREEDMEVREKRGRDERVFRGYGDAMASERLPAFERDDWMYFTRIYWTRPPAERDLEV